MKFKTKRKKNVARRQLPAVAPSAKQPTAETTAPPEEGPGSITELLHFLDDHRHECNWGCKDDAKCEHKFSLHHSWELLEGLKRLPEDRLEKIPAPAQNIIRKIHRTEAQANKALEKVASYIPQNKRERLFFSIKEEFKQLNRSQIKFCVAYAYAQGVRHHEREVKSHILFCTDLINHFLAKHSRPEFAKAYLEHDWIIYDRDRKKAEASAAAKTDQGDK